ncbi:MAG: hypothetical protein ACLSHG_10535 [Oscillospiraceae bacterium]
MPRSVSCFSSACSRARTASACAAAFCSRQTTRCARRDRPQQARAHRLGCVQWRARRVVHGGRRVCGALGAVITHTPNIKSMVFTVAGALVLLIGLRMAGILPGLRSSWRRSCPVRAAQCAHAPPLAGRPLIIGLLTGVMRRAAHSAPCGSAP